MAAGIKVHNQNKSPTTNGVNGNGAAPKVVGPNVTGNKEEYQLVRRLQSALFGGVYEAKGLSTGKEFAIKVLHKSELSKAQESNSIEFCEVPLSEIRFAEVMAGNDYVMEPEDHFEDAYCFYVVFELARGGDLLEALKQKPQGFKETHAQFLIQQAAKGLAFLHQRKVAMHDVSLENMLLHVNETSGQYQVKVCDPGQAVMFELDETGEETPVNFRGLVGKSFRPPELHEHQPYLATKVDSWCLGWSAFYLLTAQPLFMSADPQQQDADWLLFQQGEYGALFQQKSNLCSQTGLDFIFRLLRIEPKKRMSIAEALNHAWLADPKIAPVMAPKELLPDTLRKNAEKQETEASSKETEAGTHSPVVGGAGATPGLSSSLVPCSTSSATVSGTSQSGSITWGTHANANVKANANASASHDLPTWAAASNSSQYHPQAPHTPLMRVRSPPRSPRATHAATAPRIPTDRRRQVHASGSRQMYVIATDHSPPPGVTPMSPVHGVPTRPSGARAASPLQRSVEAGPRTTLNQPIYRSLSPGQYMPIPSENYYHIAPSSASRPSPVGGLPSSINMKVENADGDENARGRAWTYRVESAKGDGHMRMGSDAASETHGRTRAISPMQLPTVATAMPQRTMGTSMSSGVPPGRPVQSPARNQGAIYFPRPLSPTQAATEAMYGATGTRTSMRPPSLVARRLAEGMGISWSGAPSISPRAGVASANAIGRTASPMAAQKPTLKPGFAWSPEPPSPRTSPRSFSPGSGHLNQGAKGIASAPISAHRWCVPPS